MGSEAGLISGLSAHLESHFTSFSLASLNHEMGAWGGLASLEERRSWAGPGATWVWGWRPGPQWPAPERAECGMAGIPPGTSVSAGKGPHPGLDVLGPAGIGQGIPGLLKGAAGRTDVGDHHGAAVPAQGVLTAGRAGCSQPATTSPGPCCPYQAVGSPALCHTHPHRHIPSGAGVEHHMDSPGPRYPPSFCSFFPLVVSFPNFHLNISSI